MSKKNKNLKIVIAMILVIAVVALTFIFLGNGKNYKGFFNIYQPCEIGYEQVQGRCVAK